jgi:hypothetical protein
MSWIAPTGTWFYRRKAYRAFRRIDSASLGLPPMQPNQLANPGNESTMLIIARLMVSLRRMDEALTLIQKIIDFAQKSGRTYTLIQARVILAKVMSLGGGGQEAVDCLTESLQLAMPEGYISTFVDEGITLRDLLQTVKDRVAPELSDYVEKVLVGFGSGEKPKRDTGNRVRRAGAGNLSLVADLSISKSPNAS